MFTSVLWQLTEPRYKRRDDVILARAPIAMRSLCRAWNRRLNKWEGGRERARWRGEESERWWRLWNNLCGREGGRRFCTAYTVITSFYSWQRGRGHKPGVTRGKAKIRVHQTWQSTAVGTQDIRALALGGGRDLLYTSLVPHFLDKSLFPLVVTFYFWCFRLHMLVPTQAQTQTRQHIWLGVEYSGRGWHSNHFPPQLLGLKAVTAADTTGVWGWSRQCQTAGSGGGREGKDMNEQIKVLWGCGCIK